MITRTKIDLELVRRMIDTHGYKGLRDALLDGRATPDQIYAQAYITQCRIDQRDFEDSIVEPY